MMYHKLAPEKVPGTSPCPFGLEIKPAIWAVVQL